MITAIFILDILAIIGTGNITINDYRFSCNWFAIAELILLIIYLKK